MTGLDDVSLISSVTEARLDIVGLRSKTDKVKNGSLSSHLDGRLSPETEIALTREDELNEDRMESSFSGESIGAVSDSDETMSERSSLDSGAMTGYDASVEEQSSEQCFDVWKMVGGQRGIEFHPDFMLYNDIYSSNAVVMFLNSCIEVKGLAAYGDREEFYIQLKIDDIIDIESQWIGRHQIATVKIHLISKGSAETESNQRVSGIKELKFLVKDSGWYEKRDAIESLDVRYKALWKIMIDTETDEHGEAVEFPTCYFPEFEPFEDFIYPEGDSDAVSISKRDVDLLQPDTFVNDTIIDFYIKYLKDNIPPEKRQKFHFFNSFFFRKLADLDKYSSSTFDGRAAFLRVRKWTRKVNLFEKDFIFIPVNHNYHWSLLVICHPGEVAEFRDEDVGKLARVPCILHMDSIRGTHVDINGRIQSYLQEEWKERQKGISEDVSSRFSSLRFVSLELPQQQNSYDCGLFLLHYVEHFLEEDPAGISPFKITPFTKFLSSDWFPPAEPSIKRSSIQKLIWDLLDNHSKESSPACGSGDSCPSNSLKTENAIEFLSERLCPKSCNGNFVCSQVEKGIEINLFPASSLSGSHCANSSGIAVRELFEPGSAPGSLVGMQYQAFDRTASFNEFKSAMASIQENVENCVNFVYPSASENGFQNIEGITAETCDYPCPPRDFREDVAWNQEISVHQTSCDHLDSSPVTSICDAGNSLEVQFNEKCQVPGEISLDNNLDETRHTSEENKDCLTNSIVSAPSEMLAVADSKSSMQGIDQDDKHKFDCLTNSIVSAPGEMLAVADSKSSMQGIDQDENHKFDCLANSIVSAPNEMVAVADSKSSMQGIDQDENHKFDCLTNSIVSAPSEMLAVADSNSPLQSLDQDENHKFDCLTNAIVSAPSEMLAVADSKSSMQRDANDKYESPKACLKSEPEFCSRVDYNRDTTCDGGEDPLSDSDVQHAAKKLRLTSSSEGEPVESPSGQLCL